MTEVHVTGLADLQKLLDTLPAKMEQNVMRGALRVGMRVVLSEVRSMLSSHGNVKTGELSRGLKLSVRARRGVVAASIKARGKHGHIAYWLEYTGAQPHAIKPKNRRALYIGGRLINEVDHPGFKPRPFMRPALDKKSSDALAAVGQYIKRRLATKAGLDTADIVIGSGE